MKNPLCNILLTFSLVVATVAYGAGMPRMEVTVSDASARIAFKGATNANGTFATGKLQPGNYVVQFNSKSAPVKGSQYLLVISAGINKVIADAVPGEKFAAGGVAMKVAVGPGLKITGQIASEQAVAFGGDPRVRVINGKRYVWVAAETGSNLGGHWEEEGLPGIIHVVSMSLSKMHQLQDRAGEGSMLGNHIPHPEDR